MTWPSNTKADDETRLIYKVQCPGVRSSQGDVKEHYWYRYEVPHPRSSYTCQDCYTLMQKEQVEAIKKLKEGNNGAL